MTNTAVDTWNFEGELFGRRTKFAVHPDRYVCAPSVVYLEVYSDYPTGLEEEAGVPTDENGLTPWDVVTVNPSNADTLFLLDEEHDVVFSHNTGGEIISLLAESGLVEPERYTQIRTGMAINPVHAMTEKGIEWYDRALEQMDKFQATA